MRCAALAAAVLLLVSAPAAAKFHDTHRFAATGRLVDRWTIDDPQECGPVGDGTLTVDFASAKPVKATPVIDPWALLAPIDPFGHVGSVPPKPAVGTIDLVDNTVPRASYDGSDCGTEPDKAGCGSHPLNPGTRVTVAGYDRRFIYVDLGALFTDYGPCHLGLADDFSTRDGVLRLRMPSPSKLRTRKVVRVTGTSHSHGTRRYTTSDVMRTATVTFTRLR